MKSPFTGGEAVLVTETRKAVFRKEEYEYTHLCYQCVDTQETFTTTQWIRSILRRYTIVIVLPMAFLIPTR